MQVTLLPDFKDATKKWVSVFSLLSLPITFGSYLGEWTYEFDLLSNFKVQIFFMLLFVILANVCLKNWKTFAWSFILFLMISSEILPWYIPNASSFKSTGELRMYVANVHTKNKKHDLFLKQIAEFNPDVIAVIEIDDKWVESLNSLEDYTYKKVVPRDDNYGIGLYSKKEMKVEMVKFFGKSRLPSIACVLDLGDGFSTNLLVVHPQPPIPKYNKLLRDAALEDMSQYLRDKRGPKLLVGDLNISMWSPNYKKLEVVSGMTNARKGFGVGTTWPANNFTHIPIDHCLHNEHFAVKHFEVLPDIGSDHSPILIDLMYEKTD